MYIVIDIPDDFYEKVQDNYRLGNGDVVQIPIECIANGTPLPKGHCKLKDIDVLEECKEIMDTITNECKYAVRMDEIRNAPTIIEADKEV